MPYAIQKKGNSNKFWVKNKTTGRKFSKKPLPLSRAKAQLAALEIHTHDHKTGKQEKQEYWKGVPPAAHSSNTFREIPDVVKKYGPFPKYHFTKKGERVFVFYS